MPRSGGGVYSKAAGSTAAPSTTIESTKYNATIDDIVADLNAPRPVSSGGTGAANAADARANLGVDSAITAAITVAVAGYLPLAGGTMTGVISLSANPASALHAATKQYVDAADAIKLPLAGGTLTGALTLAADPSSPLQAATKQYADSIAVPAGAVAHFAMNTAPTGWLKANGAAVSRTTYATLFAAIGTAYGAGDGSTTFNLPDLRGEFIRGWDDGRGVDTGRGFGTLQLDAMQGHRHLAPPGSLGFASFMVGASNYGGGSFGVNFANTGDITPDGANGTPRVASETRPRNVALLACIKY